MDFNLIFNNFLETVTFESVIKFLLLYFFVIWIALLIWIIKDIKNRTNNVFIQILSVLIILFLTPLWIFIYLLIRPGKTLYEKHYDEIEENLDIFQEIIDERKKQLEKESRKNEEKIKKHKSANFKYEKLEIVNKNKEK